MEEKNAIRALERMGTQRTKTTAFLPQWVITKLKIKLEKGSAFGIALVALVVIFFVATALSPEPPGDGGIIEKCLEKYRTA